MSTPDDLRPPAERPLEGIDADLGFGSVVARESRKRLLNRDGSFNVRREGLPLFESLSLYHYFLTISWPKLFAYLICSYLGGNALFAAAYVACGDDALTSFASQTLGQRFQIAFFFSVDTIATIGYGSVNPHSLAANILVTFEALVGLLGFAFFAGIVFARFSRPRAEIVFSRNAIVAPYRDITALMFRIVNKRSSEIVQVEAKVLLTRRKQGSGSTADREFIQLKLERDGVIFFPLAWTIVHPIDATSPLWGCDAAGLMAEEAEILALLNGFDETFSQTVHTRSSYKADEVVWGARFRSVFNPPQPDGTVSIDVGRLDSYERVPLVTQATHADGDLT